MFLSSFEVILVLLERQIIGKSKKEVLEVLRNRGYAYFEEAPGLVEGYYTHASVCLKTLRVFFENGKAIDFEIF